MVNDLFSKNGFIFSGTTPDVLYKIDVFLKDEALRFEYEARGLTMPTKRYERYGLVYVDVAPSTFPDLTSSYQFGRWRS